MGYIMGYVGGCITVCFSWDVYIYILQATKPLGGDGRFDSMDLQIQNITKSMVYIIGDIA